MLAKIAYKAHYLIIALAGLNIYEAYNEHLSNFEQEKQLIPNIKKRVEKEKKSKKDIKDYFTDIEEARNKIKVVTEEVELLKKQLPSEISDTENLETLKGLAEGLNLRNIYLQPENEEKKDFYYLKHYSIKSVGTFLQFLTLLEKIDEIERVFNINSIVLEKLPEKQKGRFQLVSGNIIVDSYRYNPPDPSLTPTPTPTPKDESKP